MKYTHSLWITPSPEISKILQDIISNLVTEYNGERFQPHMTLLDVPGKEKEVLEKAVRLAKEIEPFKVELGELSFSTTYFQNVFVRIKSNAKLMDANLKAKKIYEVENNVFMPHMSLLYGEQSMEVREKAASQLEIPKGLSFTVDKLVVIQQTKVTADWKPVAQIGLNK